MNRTQQLKWLYALCLLLLASLCYGLVSGPFRGREILGSTLLALLLLVPGRVQGHYFRDLFRGRRLFDGGQYEESLRHTQAFLTQIEEHPGRRWLLWLSFAVYTTRADAMAWNNCAAAYTELGQLDDAHAALTRALELDPKYPLPHFNLARLALVSGDRESAEHHLEEARRRGYEGGTIDQLATQAQSLLARIEGQGGG